MGSTLGAGGQEIVALGEVLGQALARMDSRALGRLSDDLLRDVYVPHFWDLSRTSTACDAERHLFGRAFLDGYHAGATRAA